MSIILRSYREVWRDALRAKTMPDQVTRLPLRRIGARDGVYVITGARQEGEIRRTTMQRCPWCLMNERQTRYHDQEWGVPVHDDRKQFEFLMLEAMQCGLSWDTVLRKREIFRGCFDGFDYDKVAAYTDEDVDRIMAVPGMIRSRRKIEAVIHNARCVQRIRVEFGTFSDYLWGWTKGKTMLYKGHELGHIPASNDLSDRIAKDLKKRGMKYIGSVTVYAHLQACGIVNDHMRECFRYRALVESADTEILEYAYGGLEPPPDPS